MAEYVLQNVVFSDLDALHARLKSVSPKFMGLMHPPLTLLTSSDLTPAELQAFQDRAQFLDVLDSWESSKLRNLTLAQVNTAVDNISDLTSAKVVLKKLAQVTLWLLKREMREL